MRSITVDDYETTPALKDEADALIARANELMPSTPLALADVAQIDFDGDLVIFRAPDDSYICSIPNEGLTS